MSNHQLEKNGVAFVIVLVAIGPNSRADETTSQPPDRAATVAQLTRTVESYSIFIGDHESEQLELTKSPVLHYSDTISPVTDGLVFAWNKAGRPEAVMALHPGTQGHTWIEFRSLSQSPLTAVRNGRNEWRPNTAGVEFQPLPDAPDPDPTPARRMTQMRSLLRPFTAFVVDRVNGRQPLRMLPQPLIRYTQPERGILDGGLFAFVLSTNPELMLVVEAQVTDGKPRWMYAIARFSGRQAEFRIDDRPIWPTSELPSTKDPKEPFYQLRVLIGE